MITIYSLKPKFQKALTPLLRMVARLRITPNQVTLFTMIFSIGVGIFFFLVGEKVWWLMPFVCFLRMAFNAIDGMLARQFRMQSKIGTFLNELGDLVSDFFLYTPFILLFPFTVGAILFLSMLSEVAGILGEVVGGKRRYDGPIGKSDRAFFFSIMGCLLSFGWMPLVLGNCIFGMVAFLLLLTIYFRVKASC